MAEKEIKTGIVGLGAIGAPVATRLAGAGIPVAAFDTSAARLAAAGPSVKVAGSCADLASDCELILLLVSTDADVERAMFGPAGIVEGIRPGTVVAVCSSVLPETVQGLRRRIHRDDVHILDAPVSRGEQAARSGDLSMFIGGDADIVARVRPVLSVMASAIHHVGPLGAGQVTKMANNLVFWSCICANHEAMALAQAHGADLDAVREAIVGASGGNFALKVRAETMPLPTAEKDMMGILHEADALGIVLPLSGLVKETIKGIKLEIARRGPSKA